MRKRLGTSQGKYPKLRMMSLLNVYFYICNLAWLSAIRQAALAICDTPKLTRHECKQKHPRCRENHSIEAVEQSTMPGNQFARIFDAVAALDERFGEIPHLRKEIRGNGEYENLPPGNVIERNEARNKSCNQRERKTADSTFD